MSACRVRIEALEQTLREILDNYCYGYTWADDVIAAYALLDQEKGRE